MPAEGRCVDEGPASVHREVLPIAQEFAVVAVQLTSYLVYHGIVGVVSSLAGHIRSSAGRIQIFGGNSWCGDCRSPGVIGGNGIAVCRGAGLDGAEYLL